MKFGIWTAVSTAAQAEDDKDSLHVQETKARAVALAKGWEETAGVYVAPGESRTRFVNLRDAEESISALRAMLEDAKAGRFDILVMWDYNRLRDLLDPVAKTLANYGVQIYSVNQPTEPMPPEEFNPYASDSESMMRGMSQIISRWQIADLRRKYRFGIKARVDRGLPSLKIPYGYMKPPGMESDPKVIPVPHPVYSHVVVDIKNNFLFPTPINQLVEYLTARYPTPTGIPVWSKQTIRKILLNPFYAGKVSFGRRLTVHDSRMNIKRLVVNANPYTRDGAHVPLYSHGDYLAILAEFERRSTLPTLVRYPWSGMLQCGECGHGLRRKQGRYVCESCRAVIIHDAELQKTVGLALQASLRDLHPEPYTSFTTTIQPAVSDLERSRKRIQQAYESNVYSIQEAEEKIKSLEEKIKALKDTELSQARAQAERAQFQITYEEAQELLDVLPEWMLDDEPKIVNSLLTRLFRGIKIMGDGRVVPVLRN